MTAALLMVAAIATVVVSARHGWWVMLGCVIAGLLLGIRDTVRDEASVRRRQ